MEKEVIEGAESPNNNTTHSILSSYNINVASQDEEGELFATRMLELYGSFEDSMNDIIRNREQYENTDDPSFIHHRNLISYYDMYLKVKDTEPEVGLDIFATMLWYTYKNISGDDDNISQFVEDIPEEGKAPKLNHKNVAFSMIRKYSIISFSDMCYVYINGQYYDSKTRVEKDIVNLLMSIGYNDKAKVGDITRDIMFRIVKSTLKFGQYPFNQKAKLYIPVKNGVVVRKSFNMLLPQSPVWGFTFSLNVKYDPNADTKPIKEFLESIVATDEDFEILIQIPAHALLQNEHFQTSYLLQGSGANGKSTFLSVTTNLVGAQNITSVSLQEIIENRFIAAELQDKLLNIYPDLPSTSLKSTGKYKALTGSDQITVEKKYADPFQIVNKAVMVFSANIVPTVDDDSYAFWRRWNIVSFPYTFKVDPEFLQKLTTPENMSGYLNLIIDKMNKIEKYGLTITKVADQAKDMWKRKSDTCYAYYQDMLEKSPLKYTKIDDLYSKYLIYCENEGIVPEQKPKFINSLIKFGGIESKLGEQQHRFRVIRGIVFKEKILPEIRSDSGDNEEPPSIFKEDKE